MLDFLITFKNKDFSQKDILKWPNVCMLIDRIIFLFNISTIDDFINFQNTNIEQFKFEASINTHDRKLINTYKDILNLLILAYPGNIYAKIKDQIYDGINYHGIIPYFYNLTSKSIHIRGDNFFKNALTLKKEFDIDYCIKENIQLPDNLKLLLCIFPKDVVGYIGKFAYVIVSL